MRTVTLKEVVLGEGPAKVIVPLTGVDDVELEAQAAAVVAGPTRPDIVEWRLDWYRDVFAVDAVLESARRLGEALPGMPILATFRTAHEGGEQSAGPEQYADLYGALCASGLVDAVDVEAEYDSTAVDAVAAAARAAGVAVVMSHHDFASTPSKDEIVARLTEMQRRGADILKVAYMAQSPSDVLALLGATWAFHSDVADRPVLTMSMSGTGAVSRMAGEVFGSCATFASAGRASAPGQVPLEQLRPVLRLIHDGLA